ncbi:hypothetical protein Hanom_Chr10g00942841 [Helianthus anomalus]
MTLAEFAVHTGLCLWCLAFDDPFIKILAGGCGCRYSEHIKAKGRISHVDDPLYMRSCAFAHGLAQYFASAHHQQERRFLYGDAYVTIIARSLGYLPEADL